MIIPDNYWLNIGVFPSSISCLKTCIAPKRNSWKKNRNSSVLLSPKLFYFASWSEPLWKAKVLLTFLNCFLIQLDTLFKKDFHWHTTHSKSSTLKRISNYMLAFNTFVMKNFSLRHLLFLIQNCIMIAFKKASAVLETAVGLCLNIRCLPSLSSKMKTSACFR